MAALPSRTRIVLDDHFVNPCAAATECLAVSFLAWFKRRRFEVTVRTLRGRVHRVLYHHEKQLDKVVRRHNSHDRNAMRRLEFNFIKISCVTYKAQSTPSLREASSRLRSFQVLPGIEL